MQAALPEDFVTIDRSLRPPGRRRPAPLIIRPFAIHRGFLDGPAQHPLRAEVRRTWDAAPPVRPVTRRASPVPCHDLGRTADRRGCRHEPAQPDGRPWPPTPAMRLGLWRRVTYAPVLPDS